MSHDTTRVQVQRTIDAPADAIFDVLVHPHRHAEIDGSEMIRSDEHTQRIAQVGDVFTMNMHSERMGGDYQTDNHVTGYAKDRLLAWQTGLAGQEPGGWEWVWELEPQGPHQTLVTLACDWSKVTDKKVLERVHFPAVSPEKMEHSLAKLAEAVSS